MECQVAKKRECLVANEILLKAHRTVTYYTRNYLKRTTTTNPCDDHKQTFIGWIFWWFTELQEDRRITCCLIHYSHIKMPKFKIFWAKTYKGQENNLDKALLRVFFLWSFVHKLYWRQNIWLASLDDASVHDHLLQHEMCFLQVEHYIKLTLQLQLKRGEEKRKIN